VRKYKPKRRGTPSQTCRTFLENHLDCTVGMDFFVVATASFRLLYVLVIVSHERRCVLHFNGTASPSAAWTALRAAVIVSHREPHVEAWVHEDQGPGAPQWRHLEGRPGQTVELHPIASRLDVDAIYRAAEERPG
jgi:hypothetical protein